MAIVDSRGRLFGKVNLIDAVVGFVVLLLVPLAYGAYVLFRVPPPKVTSFEPATFVTGREQRVEIRGEHLRPYLKARVGDNIAEFLVQSPVIGEVKVPPLSPGAYDLSLYDEAQELVRLPEAITVTEPPAVAAPPVRQTRLRMVVRFVVRPELFDRVRAGATSPWSEQSGGSAAATQKHMATLVSISDRQSVRSLVSIGLDPDPARPNNVYHQVEQTMTTFDGVVEATADDTPAGWRFNGQLVKPGGIFSFETHDYTIRGWILTVAPTEKRTSNATP